MYSPAAMDGAAPSTVTRSRCPRALMRRTQKPLSALWKVTRSTKPANGSRSLDEPDPEVSIQTCIEPRPHLVPNITLGCDSVMWNPPLFSVRPFISSQDHAPRQSKVAVKFRLYIEGSDAYFFSVPRQPFSCLGLIGMPVG